MQVVVLGTVQDGGLPHPGCRCSRCEAARQTHVQPRYRSCLGIVSSTGRTFLLDATPDIPHQLHLLKEKAGQHSVGEHPVDGILLTHAHAGHYMGLWYLGTEAMNASGQPVFCTQSMREFLTSNQPWRGMISGGQISIRQLNPGSAVRLDELTEAEAIQVPHRNEHSDTICYLITSGKRAILYLPDLDTWDGFYRDFNHACARVDHVFVDGTFCTTEELARHTGRELEHVPHPPVAETVRLIWEGRLRPQGTKMHLIHLNHTNPLHQVSSDKCYYLPDDRLRVARQGQVFGP